MVLMLSRPELLKQARDFNTKKHLGQHFLVDPDKLAKICKASNIQANDTVIEIGPGLGFLTHYLVDTKAQVYAVELDGSCARALEEWQAPNLHVVHGDFLQFDLENLRLFKKIKKRERDNADEPSQDCHPDAQPNDCHPVGAGSPRPHSDEEPSPTKIKIIGNVPYQITSPIVVYLLGEIDKPAHWTHLIDSAVMTIQKEVAERLVAKPGGKDYSLLTILARLYADTTMLEVIESRSFWPPPEVQSAVIKIVPLAKPRVDCQSYKLLRQVVTAGFRQRRKMLKNNLAFTGLSQEELLALFHEQDLDPQVRAERLSLEQFAKLTDRLLELKPKEDGDNGPFEND
jgi:16S rRNA (adenine1518-N6/adenine1519-N6)-dimethyltransferase